MYTEPVAGRRHRRGWSKPGPPRSSTNVTTEQVRYLPQNQRNFLNFAALAPGARVSDDETRKQVTGGGLDATQINVFIDGVSFKNDVLDGGVVGQDSSRGSPFPQTAVQEFQVLTQNYKAEHEKASSLVITRGDQERRQPVVGRGVPLLSEQEPRSRTSTSPRSAATRSRPTSGSSRASRSAGRSSRTGCRSSGRTRRTGRTATAACSSAARPLRRA